MICIISAIGKNGVIGTGSGLPWHIPEEYNKFLDHVRGNTVIMGRKSWEIFGADLPETRFIIVSNTLDQDSEMLIAGSVEQAVSIARTFPEDIFIAGGAGVYQEGIPLADKMYLSFIKGDFEGNVFFPDFNPDDWEVTKSENYSQFLYTEFLRNPKTS